MVICSYHIRGKRQQATRQVACMVKSPQATFFSTRGQPHFHYSYNGKTSPISITRITEIQMFFLLEQHSRKGKRTTICYQPPLKCQSASDHHFSREIASQQLVNPVTSGYCFGKVLSVLSCTFLAHSDQAKRKNLLDLLNTYPRIFHSISSELCGFFPCHCSDLPLVMSPIAPPSVRYVKHRLASVSIKPIYFLPHNSS